MRNPIAGRGQDDNRAVAAGYAVAGALGAIWRELESAFPPIQPSKPPSVELLTFRDVVQYFTDNHPGDPRIKSGALLKQPHPKGFLIFQVFLDRENQVCVDSDGHPYGRTLVAKELDDELAVRFDGSDLVIFR